jgi:hypothetical protein
LPRASAMLGKFAVWHTNSWSNLETEQWGLGLRCESVVSLNVWSEMQGTCICLRY